jgi:hypothetical protein
MSAVGVPAGAHMRRGGQQAPEREVRMPGDDVDGRRACTFVGHVQHLHLRDVAEQLGREMRDGAGIGLPEAEPVAAACMDADAHPGRGDSRPPRAGPDAFERGVRIAQDGIVAADEVQHDRRGAPRRSARSERLAEEIDDVVLPA